jgi:rubrerythrin
MAPLAPRTTPDPLGVRAVAWLAGQWAFRSLPRTARLLHGFARTEEQSQLELRQAARLCTDERRRARYLRHALDESRHARAFAERSSELAQAAGSVGFPRPTAACESLFERWGELRFLAFVHAGERRGRVEFETYARLLRRRGADTLALLFEDLLQDERQHEAYSARLLEELAGKAGAGRALRWAATSGAWREFRRRGRALAGALYAATMLLVYVALAPFALAYRALSPKPRGFSREP